MGGGTVTAGEDAQPLDMTLRQVRPATDAIRGQNAVVRVGDIGMCEGAETASVRFFNGNTYVDTSFCFLFN
jgi:hypothetical protein